MNLILSNYNKLITNHYRLKLSVFNFHELNAINKIIINTSLKSILSFKIKEVIESLFYFRLLTNNKSYISYYKKKYKECDLIIKIDLKKKSTNFILLLWTIFYFPSLHRREIFFKKSTNSGGDIMFSCNLYNIYPYISDIYFSWTNKVVYTILFNESQSLKNYLLLSYYNFPKK